MMMKMRKKIKDSSKRLLPTKGKGVEAEAEVETEAKAAFPGKKIPKVGNPVIILVAEIT